MVTMDVSLEGAAVKAVSCRWESFSFSLSKGGDRKILQEESTNIKNRMKQPMKYLI